MTRRGHLWCEVRSIKLTWFSIQVRTVVCNEYVLFCGISKVIISYFYFFVKLCACRNMEMIFIVRYCCRPLHRGRGLKCSYLHPCTLEACRPLHRGRGLKCANQTIDERPYAVALFTEAWIEMKERTAIHRRKNVALYTEGVD